MISDITRKQIVTIRQNPDKPLIICDVDEVVLHFLRGLEEHLAENDLWLDPASFALNGNIKHLGTNTPVPNHEIGPLLHEFFVARVGSLDVIDGAASALELLSRSAEIIMLTNMPHDYKEARIINLAAHGMYYPVISNAGAKGPAVKALAHELSHPVIFLDDTPDNLHSVADTCPDVINIHFIQDIRFSIHLSEIERFSLRTDNWITAESHIWDQFGASQL